MEKFFKIVAQTPCVQVPNKEGTGQTAKCTIVLQALGSKYEDCLEVTLFGNTALCKFHPGDTVLANCASRRTSITGHGTRMCLPRR